MNPWITAFRLRTLPLALSSIILGSGLAASQGFWNGWITFLACLTTILLQILSNIANDYGDSLHGADKVANRVGPLRMVSSGEISANQMKIAIVLLSVLAFLSGIGLLWTSNVFSDINKTLIFLGLGISSIAAAILYTNGKKPYGYQGLGDISVFIFFGWVGVLGSYFLQGAPWDYVLLLPATACGLFSTGVLNINNMRDIQSDVLAGKNSIPVIIGLTKAKFYHASLIGIAWVCTILFFLLTIPFGWKWLFIILFTLFIMHLKEIFQKEGSFLDPLLKKLALLTLFYCVFLSVMLNF